MTRRRALALLALPAAGLAPLAACGSTATGSADCASVIRIGEVTYTGIGGAALRPERPIGEADVSSCTDNGPDAAGAYFRDDPTRVTAWEIAGIDTDDAIAVGADDETWSVYVSEDLSRRERETVLRRVTPPASDEKDVIRTVPPGGGERMTSR